MLLDESCIFRATATHYKYWIEGSNLRYQPNIALLIDEVTGNGGGHGVRHEQRQVHYWPQSKRSSSLGKCGAISRVEATIAVAQSVYIYTLRFNSADKCSSLAQKEAMLVTLAA